MGLLDGFLGNGFEDPRSAAIMALSGGLLQGNFGAALTGAQSAFTQAKQAQQAQETELLKRGLLSAQIDETKAQAAERQAGIEKQRQLQSMIDSIFNAPPPASVYGPGQLGSGSFGAVSPMAGQTDMPSPQPQGSRLGNATPDQIALLNLVGGKDLSPLWKTVKEGFERKPGTFYEDMNGRRSYTPDPTKGMDYQGGRISPIPGYSEFLSAQTMATEGPKASFDMITVPTPNGDVMMTRQQAAQMAGGTQQPTQFSQQSAPQIGGGQNLTPALRALIQRDAMANGISNPQTAFTGAGQGQGYGVQGEQGGALSSGPGIRLRTPQQKADDAARQAGAEASARLPAQAQEGINQSFIKTSYEPVLAAGQSATGLIETVQTTRQAMQNMGKTGWSTELQAQAKNVLAGLGMASDNATMFAANSQVFQSKAMERLWTTLNEAKGPQTEGDATRASKTYASLANTTKANEFILDMAEAKAQRDQIKARFYQQALPVAQSKGNLAEIDREWSSRAPSIFSMPTMQKWAGGIK